MKTLNYFLNLCEDVKVQTKTETVTIITAQELRTFVSNVYGQKWINKAQAKKVTGLSYLSGVNSSAKIVKGLKKEINTLVLYLKPYKTAFGNVCAMGEHCNIPCLTTSGRVKMDQKEFKILRSRYFKTVLFYVNRDLFNSWLFAEIETAEAKFGDSLMVRVNGTSDLSLLLFKVDGINILERFPSVTFYDYTKILNRIFFAAKYPNYHITFSYSGYNDDECKEAIQNGVNVSIVVNGPQPKTFNGVNVFSMDETDVRPLDEATGQYGYLKLKETLSGNYDTKFVINSNDKRLSYVD